MRSLDTLNLGESGIIKEIRFPDIALRLNEMGCIPGAKVTLTKIAPLGDPIAIEVSGYELSLRKKDASSVILENEA